jgi:hypothetical protein
VAEAAGCKDDSATDRAAAHQRVNRHINSPDTGRSRTVAVGRQSPDIPSRRSSSRERRSQAAASGHLGSEAYPRQEPDRGRQSPAVTASDLIDFLRRLVRAAPKKVLLVLEDAGASRPIRTGLARGARRRDCDGFPTSRSPSGGRRSRGGRGDRSRCLIQVGCCRIDDALRRLSTSIAQRDSVKCEGWSSRPSPQLSQNGRSS